MTSPPWSDEVAIAIRPFSTYAALGRDRDKRSAADAARAVGLLLLFLGAFVSLTTAGRLVAAHLALTALFWGFVPVLQIGALAAALRIADRRARLAPAISLYFQGHAPYFVFFLVLSGLVMFAPDVYGTMTALLRVGALPIFLLATIVWGVTITWAFFREALDLPRSKARIACAVFYAIFVGVVVGYYLAMNEIQPQVSHGA